MKSDRKKNTSSGLYPLQCFLALSSATALFSWVQNQGWLVGGEISMAKALWLNYTMAMFLIFPVFWYRNAHVSQHLSKIFWTGSFLWIGRAICMLPILYLTNWWRCEYGYTHTLVTFAIVMTMYLFRKNRPHNDRFANEFFLVYGLMMLIEAFMEFQFGQLADPRQGTYFAANTPHFQFVNQITWIVVLFAYPHILSLFWRARHQFQ